MQDAAGGLDEPLGAEAGLVEEVEVRAVGGEAGFEAVDGDEAVVAAGGQACEALPDLFTWQVVEPVGAGAASRVPLTAYLRSGRR
ncbi:hypothetical protein [Streptomyces shenzhenensis]|uniref:hypothetical protein n=1 Tax=Streptomyces shenzhenensis TaxID=943815 RepID=UPI001F1A4CA5|nr:hypothetical protein [Streptomyces shenzhenensis]